MTTPNKPNAAEVKLTDDYGSVVYPDDQHAGPIYKEVCIGDTYGFRSLKKTGLQVKTAVDLGASYGVASRMIRYHWPESRIIAFEPEACRFPYLVRNCPGTECRDCSVAGFAHDPDRLEDGIGLDGGKWRPNVKEIVAWLKHGQLLSVAEAMAGIESIDLLKIDVEGCELGIIQEMKEMGLLARTRMVVGEWHFENARLGLIELFAETHDFKHKNPPGGNPWNSFQATLKLAT